MTSSRSNWMHRTVAAAAILGITGIVYADHCYDLQLGPTYCGATSGPVYGNDCSHWDNSGEDPVWVSCPNQLWWFDTPGQVEVCVSGQNSGSTGCVVCGTVKAKHTRQYYACVAGSCNVVPFGEPVVLAECCTAQLTGSPCGHPEG